MKNKETLFSKNNYDIQLEEVLDKKEFDDEAKSLILGILYRIEESYKDYAKVKLNVNGDETTGKWDETENGISIEDEMEF